MVDDIKKGRPGAHGEVRPTFQTDMKSCGPDAPTPA